MKNYIDWARLCKKIENREPKLHFRKREVWWCHLGQNIGNEEDGKHNLFERPILILKKINNQLFVGLPLTTKYSGEHYKFCIG